jgi:hypothetical protein
LGQICDIEGRYLKGIQGAKSLCRGVGCPRKILFPYFAAAGGEDEREDQIMSSKVVSPQTREVTKIDLRKELKQLYNPPAKEVALVEVPGMNFLMIDGSGNPNTSQEYKDALEALYNLSYTLKFLIKKEMAIDYPVMALEGLWWTNNMLEFSMDNKDIWQWTSMIVQPEYVTAELVTRVCEELKKKKDLPALSKLRFERFHEGLSAQIMHLGPFAAEKPTIEKLYAFIKEHGYEFNGKHHEIYLSDPRRAAPEKFKTVLRQPVKRVS